MQENLAIQLGTYISNHLSRTLYLVPDINISCPEPIISNDVIWTTGSANLNDQISRIFSLNMTFKNGQFPPFETDGRIIKIDANDSWVGCLATSESDADSKIKRFAGALSIALELPHSRTFTMAEPPEGRVQFGSDGSWTFRIIPSAFPPLFKDINITQNMVTMIRNLLVDYNHGDVMHNRILIALEYLAEGWEPFGRLGFLHNAIAIDALFGINGRVKSSIINGLSTHANQINNITRRGELLYKMRCDLMHGSSQALELCPDYLTYYDEFSVDPALDQLQILRTCLWNLSGVSET